MLHLGLGFVHPRRREGVARPKTGMDFAAMRTALDSDSPTDCVVAVDCTHGDSLQLLTVLPSASTIVPGLSIHHANGHESSPQSRFATGRLDQCRAS